MSGGDTNERNLGGDDALAAEYVLGVLDADERRAAAVRIDADRHFAQLVDRWEATLSPLGASYEPVDPPAGLKARIDARLFATAPARAGWNGLWNSLPFWRGLTAAAALALALYAALPLVTPPQPDAARERLIASLAPQQSDVHYFVLYDASARDIGLSHVTGERASDRDFELWVIEGDRAPESLGVIPAGSNVHLSVSEDMERRIAAGAVFAISLEPQGGSPTGAPTGPVVAAGDLKGI